MSAYHPGRQSGFTKELVKALEPRSVVIVHSDAMVSYISRMIEDVRGVAFWKDIMILKVESPTDLYGIAGIDRPVAVDHAFWEAARADTQTAVREIMIRRSIKEEADIRKSPSPPARPKVLEIKLSQPRIKGMRARGDNLLTAINRASRIEVMYLFDNATAEVYDVAELSIPEDGTDAPYGVKLRLRGT